MKGLLLFLFPSFIFHSIFSACLKLKMPLGSRKAGSHLVKINFTSIRFGSVSHFNEQVDAVEGDGLEESEREGDREP